MDAALLHDHRDKLIYFPARSKGEPVRMTYALAGKDFTDERIPFSEWTTFKTRIPLGQVPVLITCDGFLTHSPVIGRYVARKYGLMGSNQWESALHDVIIECVQELKGLFSVATGGIYNWMIFKRVPEPENRDEVLKVASEKWLETLKFIQTLSDERGKQFIIGDEIGIGEIWLYTGMEFSQAGLPSIMSLTPWATDFTNKMQTDPKLKHYLETRPESELGI